MDVAGSASCGWYTTCEETAPGGSAPRHASSEQRGGGPWADREDTKLSEGRQHAQTGSCEEDEMKGRVTTSGELARLDVLTWALAADR